MHTILLTLMIGIFTFLVFNLLLATSLYIIGVIYRKKVNRNNEG